MLLTGLWLQAAKQHTTVRAVRFYSHSLFFVPVPRSAPSNSSHSVHSLTIDVCSADGMSTAKDFLAAIGRDVVKRVNVEKWEDLFLMRRNDFKKLGVGVQDRKWAHYYQVSSIIVA